MLKFLTINDIEEIEIDLTGCCNLQCPLCTRNYTHAKHLIQKNIRSLNEIQTQLNSFKNLKRMFIAGAVSEPTLYPQFLEFILYLNSRNITYEIFTNGNTHDIFWWKKLGQIVKKQCMVCFTICGSTQKIHEKYRIGSNLQQILDNSNSYRSMNFNKNDWIQFIRFEYNKNELTAPAMINIINKFSHFMLVDSEGIRRLNTKIINHQSNIAPIKKRNLAIQYIFKTRTPLNDKYTKILCKSYNEKKIYIDQFGKISPCYIHSEFEKHYFENDIYDYTDILNYSYLDCYMCSKKVKNYIKSLKLDFIC